MSIPSHILEQLNSQADLLGMIGRHTTLKRSGGTYRGKCPFHKGNSLSFSVNPQKNLYHCFKCHASGNAFSFLKEYDNLTFMEAVNELSKQTGIEIPKEDNQALRYKRKTPTQPATLQSAPSQTVNNGHSFAANNQVKNTQDTSKKGTQPFQSREINSPYINGHEMNSDDTDSYESHYGNMPPMPDEQLAFYTQDDNQRYAQADNSDYGLPDMAEPLPNNNATEDGNLYDLLTNIGQYYQNNLRNHAPAMHYFKSRGLTDATIKEFGLGYAPEGWQHLEQAFCSDIEGLKALGLIRRSEKGRDYNLLRDRVIFPIRDNQGRVIGFGGRALDNEVQPKYINSSDSPVFHKQHVLYGYYESRQHRAKDWLVVEGYMDVIALYQAGIYGAVASMGTSINENQIARLLQLNPTLTLCFDGDSAGQKAAWRTLEVALPVLSDDKELRFLTLPGEHDPDTYISEHGVDAMREQIATALPLSQYVFAYLSERHDLSMAEGKAKLMAQVRELTNGLPKGSSFKYLLNTDIYQKLGGRKPKTVTAHDALLDFSGNGDMTVISQLQLCLLFSPQLLEEDPIGRLWQRSGVAGLPLPSKLQKIHPNHLNNSNNDQNQPPDFNRSYHSASQPDTPVLPPLPSWADFQNPTLTQLANAIPDLLPHLPDNVSSRAHFILATLPAQTQQLLAKHWQPFWKNLNDRGIEDLDDLFDDLLAQLMQQALSKQMTEAKSIVVKSYINKQWQTLSNWHKQQLAQQAAKIG